MFGSWCASLILVSDGELYDVAIEQHSGKPHGCIRLQVIGNEPLLKQAKHFA